MMFYSGYDEIVALKETHTVSRVPLRKDLFMMTTRENSATMRVVWDALSYFIRGT
jgi:hypothetical protein